MFESHSVARRVMDEAAKSLDREELVYLLARYLPGDEMTELLEAAIGKAVRISSPGQARAIALTVRAYVGGRPVPGVKRVRAVMRCGYDRARDFRDNVLETLDRLDERSKAKLTDALVRAGLVDPDRLGA
jgi:hypothetical protein